MRKQVVVGLLVVAFPAVLLAKDGQEDKPVLNQLINVAAEQNPAKDSNVPDKIEAKPTQNASPSEVALPLDRTGKDGYWLVAAVTPLLATAATLEDTRRSVREDQEVTFGVRLTYTHGTHTGATVRVFFKPSWIRRGLFSKEREPGVFILSASQYGKLGSTKVACGDTAHFSGKDNFFEIALKLECKKSGL